MHNNYNHDSQLDPVHQLFPENRLYTLQEIAKTIKRCKRWVKDRLKQRGIIPIIPGVHSYYTKQLTVLFEISPEEQENRKKSAEDRSKRITASNKKRAGERAEKGPARSV